MTDNRPKTYAQRHNVHTDDNGVLQIVSHSKNQELIETIEFLPQLPQVQYDLQRQLRELRVAANKLGLYDAADFLKNHCG